MKIKFQLSRIRIRRARENRVYRNHLGWATIKFANEKGANFEIPGFTIWKSNKNPGEINIQLPKSGDSYFFLADTKTLQDVKREIKREYQHQRIPIIEKDH